MNIKSIIGLSFGLFFVFLFSSCNKNDDTTPVYSSSTNDAQIYSFSLKGQSYKYADSTERALDSIRFIQVNKTKYAIDQVSRTIYNPDSLPFGTILRHKVAVTATYNPTYGVSSVRIVTPDSVNGYLWNSTDSIDFFKLPVNFIVTPISNNKDYSRSYNIDVRIHKVDPDTIVWRQMQSYPSSIGQSKTLLVDNTIFYTYSVQNGTVSLFTMKKAYLIWESEVVSGLPATVNPESIFNMGKIFYAIDDNGNSYKSGDGKSWIQIVNAKELKSIVGILPAANESDNQLLVIYNDGGSYYFGKTSDMSTIESVGYISISPTTNQIPSNFPIRGVASFTNYTTDKNKRMLILNGGLDASGNVVNYTWFVKNSSEGLDLTPSSKISLFGGSGLSNAIYDNKLYILDQNQFYISNTWAATWYKAPNKQKLDSSIEKRSGQTMIVDDENYIWIFGGVTTGGTYLNDVWKGRLNRLG